jgi:hypothetical protein
MGEFTTPYLSVDASFPDLLLAGFQAFGMLMVCCEQIGCLLALGECITFCNMNYRPGEVFILSPCKEHHKLCFAAHIDLAHLCFWKPAKDSNVPWR